MSISNTPQAHDDSAAAGEDRILSIDVMGNDQGGAAKSLYSVDQANPLNPALSAVSSLGAAVRIVGGQITYDPTGASALQALGAGETATDTFSYVIQLGKGALSVATVSVTVTGTNDAPVLSADTVASHPLSEMAGTTGSATADTASASLSFTDVDLSDTHTVTIGAPAATWSGGATPAAALSALQTALSSTVTDSTHSGAGSVALSFAAPDKAFDFLASGETLSVTYNVTVADGHGGASTQPVTFVVTGTNDAPSIAADATPTHGLSEAAGTTGSTAADSASATLNFTDADLNDAHTVTIGAPVATWSGGATPADALSALQNAVHSTLTDSTHSGAGSVALSFGAPDGAFDFLASGETLSVTYDVTVADGHGGASTQPVTFVVTGTNDLPVLAADPVATHTLGEAAGVTGSTAADAFTATLSFADADLSDHHTVSVGAPGISWSGGAALPAGLATTLGTSLSASVTEAGGAGAVTASFSAADGTFDFLSAGETLHVTYDLTLDDGHGGASVRPVTVEISGANDAPVISGGGVVSGAVTEDASPTHLETATGGFAFSDPDLNDHHLVSATFVSTTGDHGQLGALTPSLASDTTGGNGGSVAWTYTANDAGLQYLAAGQQVTETYTVKVDDQHGGTVTRDVTVTLTGTNDAPVLAAQNLPQLVVNGGFDSGAAGWHGVGGVEVGNGLLTYGVTPASGNVLEIDAGNIVDDVTQTIATTPGSVYVFSFDAADRSGTSPADNAFDVLWNGQVIDTVTPGSTTLGHHAYAVTATGSTGVIEFREFASNNNTLGGIVDNVSVIGGVAEAPGVTGGAGLDTAQATLTFSDLDLADQHTVSVGAPSLAWSGGPTPPAGLASVLANALTTSLSEANGSGSVTAHFAVPDAAVDFLSVGESLTVTYSVAVSDGHGGVSSQPVTFTIAGSNDAPTIAAGGDVGAVVEDATASHIETATGSLAFVDPDLHDHHTVSAVFKSTTGTHGQLGSFAPVVSSDASGAGAVSWTYSANDAGLQYLGANQSVTETYAVTVSDGHGGVATHDVSVSLTGTNDAPVVQAVAATAVNAGSGVVSADALAHASDVDQNTTLAVVNVAALPAGVTFNAASHSFSLGLNNPAYALLPQGQTATVSASYGVSDGLATTTAQTSWIVTGTNHPAVIGTGDFSSSILEADRGSPLTAPTTPVITDTEPNDSMATAQLIDTAALRVAPNGDLYDASVPAIAINGTVSTVNDLDFYKIDLKAGQLLTLDVDTHTTTTKLDSFITILSPSGAVLATNDDSNTTAGGTGSGVTQDSFLQFSVPATGLYYVQITDFHQSGQSSSGGYTLNVSLNDQSLPLSDAGSYNFTDNVGDTHTVSVTPHAGNYVGALTATVADDTAADSAGRVDWTFDVPASDVQFLAAGQVLTQSYDLQLKDGAGNTTISPVTVTLTGVNDAPLFTSGENEGFVYVTSGPQITSGVLNFVDADLTDTHSFNVTTVESGIGTFTAYLVKDSTGTGAGQIYWQLDTTGAGASGEERFNIGVSDTHGGSAQQLVTISFDGTPLPAGAGNDTVTGTTAVQTLTGGAGNDVFVFHPGTANGDHITDFAGHLAAPGDQLSFVGFDPGATFTNIDATHWQITYNNGASHEIITFDNAASLSSSDFLFS